MGVKLFLARSVSLIKVPAFTCKFLVLSSVWAGVLQQVSEEMLVPEVERAGLIHNIPGTAAAPPVSNSTGNNTQPVDSVSLTRQFWSHFIHSFYHQMSQLK